MCKCKGITFTEPLVSMSFGIGENSCLSVTYTEELHGCSLSSLLDSYQGLLITSHDIRHLSCPFFWPLLLPSPLSCGSVSFPPFFLSSYRGLSKLKILPYSVLHHAQLFLYHWFVLIWCWALNSALCTAYCSCCKICPTNPGEAGGFKVNLHFRSEHWQIFFRLILCHSAIHRCCFLYQANVVAVS